MSPPRAATPPPSPSLADPAHPAVLRLIEEVAAHGARSGRKVSLCGDAGADPRMLPLLLRRGLRAVSVAPTLVAATKAAIAAIDLTGRRAMTSRAADKATKTDAVGAYKHILADVLDRRPSGTRQRLAAALNKNRSFVSQITNPAYPVPVPAQHLSVIFEICHFSPAERQAFLDAYHAAHPRRLVTVAHGPATRRIAIDVPDLGDAKRNRALEDLMEEMARRLAQIIRGTVTEGAMKKFVNDVETVLSESLDGFAAAHADIVALGRRAKVRQAPLPHARQGCADLGRRIGP